MTVATESPGTVPVAFREITVDFPGTRALDQVSLELFRGEVHALIGENGAGKSTLVRVLYGLQPATRGSLEIDGQPRHFRSARDAILHGIALVSQEGTLVPQLTGSENILLGREKRRNGLLLDRSDLERRSQQLLRRYFTQLELDLNCPVSQLPYASQKVVEILRALERAAKVLILDEPTASLPAREKQQLTAVIRQLARSGSTIVLISHFLTEVLAMADRISVLRDGKHVATVPARGTTEQKLITLMLSRPATVQHANERAAIRLNDPSRIEVAHWTGPGFANVDLKIRAGEILGLVGLSNSGQIAFAESLYGVHAAPRGELKLDGKVVRFSSPRAARQRGIGLVPDARMLKALLGSWRIHENLSLLHLRRISQLGLPIIIGARERKMAREQKRRLSIRAYSIDQEVAGLSGGNKQKISVGRWLFGLNGEQVYRVMIFVEPTEGVDVGAKAEIHLLIAGLAEKGCAVLLVSSDLLEVAALSDRVSVFVRGSIVRTFAQSEFAESAFIGAMSQNA